MTDQLTLDQMPAIAPLHDYQDRLLRHRVESAGELMSDRLATVVEFYFEVDCIVLPVRAQRLFAEGWLS